MAKSSGVSYIGPTMQIASPIRVALYGGNGHQIQERLVANPHAMLQAVSALPKSELPSPLCNDPAVREYGSLEKLLEDPQIQLVSLCSPRRADQARHAIAAMEAGKHVYAEKPCAMSESDLDAIIATSRRTGMKFHEMAGTAFEYPYLQMRQLVADGAIGTVVQIYAQKSYQWHTGRPQDEAVDGGLIGQNGIHAVRFVEHVGCVRVARVLAFETTLGDPAKGDGLRMASTLIMELVNGGVATVIANYLNPPGINRWGNEEVRIWGTGGMLEATDAATKSRVIIGTEDRGPVPAAPSHDYFDLYLSELRGVGLMPLTMEEELHPTRVVIQAKAYVKSRVI